MYSIVLHNGSQWWASRASFERLVDHALTAGLLDPRFEAWRELAAFYSGFDSVDESSAEEAAEFSAGLAAAARQELMLLGSGSVSGADDAYRTRLIELLDALAAKEGAGGGAPVWVLRLHRPLEAVVGTLQHELVEDPPLSFRRPLT